MRSTTRAALAIGCAGLLAFTAQALSQTAPRGGVHSLQAHRTIAKQRTALRSHKNNPQQPESRLVSTAIRVEPERPPFGWPALVAEARKYLGTNPTGSRRLWCARFMNFVLAKAGYAGTNSDAAKSFAQYGRRISGPQIGAIAVLTRGRRGGHVGVVTGIDAHGNPIIISGNHGHSVGEAVYPRSRVIAYVMPTGRSQPGQPEQAAARAAPVRAGEGSISSPIAELMAAIESEQGRPETRPRAAPRATAVQRAPQTPERVVQQLPQVSEPVVRREQPAEPGLGDFLGLTAHAQGAPVRPQQR